MTSGRRQLPADTQYEGDPWDRQPKENARQYERFQIYLEQPADSRNIRHADMEFRARHNMRQDVTENATYQVSRKHRWRERAEAFDAYKQSRIVHAMRQRRIYAVERQAKDAADAQELAMLPVQAFRARFASALGGKGESFLDDLEGIELLKLAKAFGSDLPALQRAEREAYDAANDLSTDNPGAALARGEIVRKMLLRPDVIALMEKMTVEVPIPASDTG